MATRSRKTSRLETALNVVNTPVFLLDHRRRVTFFNAGCEQLTGRSAEDVVGEFCDYNSDADHETLESVLGQLCPPPEVSAGKPVEVPTYLSQSSGKTVARLIHFFPLIDENDHVDGVLGMITPIEQPSKPLVTTPARQLHAELASLRNALRRRFGVGSLLGQSASMIRVLEQIKLACSSKVTVLLHGASGTGKEHAARMIHFEREGNNRSFVPLDCKSIPPRELKQTLKRLLADEEQHKTESDALSMPILQPGTLYLKNVESLPRDLQQMICEAFQQGTAGSLHTLRLMAAASADLKQAVEQDAILREFHYLLTPLEIELPPLRHRSEDLEILSQSFLEEFNRGAETQIGGFSDEVWKRFRQYNWPGNLDELKRVIKEARSVCSENLIHHNDLPFRFRTGLKAQSVSPTAQPRGLPLKEHLEHVEREQIQETLLQCKQNKTKAAQLLGITRPRLYRRMQTLGIEDRGMSNER
ncbi:MAG: sigma 54-interacting transcriptional regulator [Planctomycetes bacterium]|nr:sigma 54-interacting transcriptional regulator [Planctomycetota bacterium]